MGLSNRQWGNLLKDIERQRCILLLGPRLALGQKNGAEEPLIELLAQHLSNELAAEGIPFETAASRDLSYIAQRFMTIPKIRRIDLEDEAISFYQKHQQTIPHFYKHIANLPFHLIINTTPEDFILKAFRKAGKLGARLMHYNYRKEMAVDLFEPTPGNPLIYNLLGDLSDPESLVLSQENQVDFIKNVVKGNPPIPNQLMRHFDDRKTYLFLGFNLEKWYFRLILDSLKLGDKNMTIAPQLDNYPVTSITQSFYEDRYRFVFIAERIDHFLERLATDFKANLDTDKPNPSIAETKKIVLLFDNNQDDQATCQKLTQHLFNLQKQGSIEVWHRDLSTFGEVDNQLKAKLEEADLILPLLSASFFASESINQQDLAWALEAKSKHNTQILPILCKPCLYEDSTLGQLIILPSNQKAINNWDNEDEAFQQIVEQIKLIVHD